MLVGTTLLERSQKEKERERETLNSISNKDNIYDRKGDNTHPTQGREREGCFKCFSIEKQFCVVCTFVLLPSTSVRLRISST